MMNKARDLSELVGRRRRITTEAKKEANLEHIKGIYGFIGSDYGIGAAIFGWVVCRLRWPREMPLTGMTNRLQLNQKRVL